MSSTIQVESASGLYGGNAFSYAGTGAAAPANTRAACSSIPCTPGESLALSGWIDASNVVGIAQRGTAQTASQGAAGSLTITKPTGVVSGDVLYAFLMIQNPTVGTITTPAGWTWLNSTTLAAGTNQALLQVFRRVSDGTDGTSYSFAFSASQALSNGSVIAYSGVNNTNPEDVSVVFTTGQSDADGNATLTGVTTASVGARLLVAAVDPIGAATPLTPAGLAQQWVNNDATNNQTTIGFDAMMPQPNAMAPVLIQGFNSADYFLAAVLALKPANPYPLWSVMDTGLTTQYATAYQAPGLAGVVSTSFDVPTGVTAVVVVADLNECIVTSGQNLLFSNPQLEEGTESSEWEETATDDTTGSLVDAANPGHRNFSAVAFLGAAGVDSSGLVITGGLAAGAVTASGDAVWSGSNDYSPAANAWSTSTSPPYGVWAASPGQPSPSLVSLALQVNASTDPIKGHLLIDMEIVNAKTGFQAWVQIVNDLGTVVFGPSELDMASVSSQTSINLAKAGSVVKFSDTAGARTYTAQFAVNGGSYPASATVTRAEFHLMDYMR